MESILTQTQLPHRISLSQAAQLSGYHQDYLGQLCRLGKLRAAKIGRNWYTTQSELQSLVNNSEAYGFINNALAEVQDNSNHPPQIDSVVQIERAMQSPVVAANYVISEVQDMPIRLEQQPQLVNSHHSLQTLITRMKLDKLKTEVLQVTGLIGEISDEVMNHTEILKRHEQILSTRADLRDQYSPSLSFSETSKPVVCIIDFEQDQHLINSGKSTNVFWFWPVLTLLLAIVVSGLFIKSNNFDTQPQLSTVIYKTAPITNFTPQVAGDQTNVIPK